MVELKRFDLRNPDEMEQFNSYFIEYLPMCAMIRI